MEGGLRELDSLHALPMTLRVYDEAARQEAAEKIAAEAEAKAMEHDGF